MDLLKRLNCQRVEGQFCDCVIRTPLQPGSDRLYLAHRNILAASSPILASLLTTTGALLDLQDPCLTVEVLGSLLDYIYTGTLPPPHQDLSLMSAATYLKMEDLQQSLKTRMDAAGQSAEFEWTAGSRHPHLKRKKISDQQTYKKKDVSPSQWPLFPLSCEVVPVICHSRTIGRPPLLADDLPQGHLASSHGRTEKGSEVSCQQHCLHISDLERDEVDEAVLCQPRSKHSKCASTSTESSSVQKIVVGASEEAAYNSRGERVSLGSSRLHSSGKAVLAQSVVCSNLGSEYLLSSQYETTGQKGNSSHSSSNIHISMECHGNPTSDHSSTRRQTLDLGHHSVSTCDQAEPKTEEISSFRCSFPIFENISGADDVIADSFQNRLGPNFTSRPCSLIEDIQWMEPGRGPKIHPRRKNRPEEMATEDSRHDITTSDMYKYQGQVLYHCVPRETHLPAPFSESDEDSPLSSPNHSPRQDSSLFRHPLDISSRQTSYSPQLDIATNPLSAASTDLSGSAVGVNVPGSGGGGGQPHQCSLCERAFSQRGSLNRHLRSHLGVRPYSCPQCPMSFSRQYRVTEHMRVHQRGLEDLHKTGPA